LQKEKWFNYSLLNYRITAYYS